LDEAVAAQYILCIVAGVAGAAVNATSRNAP
jgi:hypothetical protein